MDLKTFEEKQTIARYDVLSIIYIIAYVQVILV